MLPVDSSSHNHQRCIDAALERARQLCKSRRLRLTPIREQVLICIWDSHRPIGAYAILDALAQQSARRPAPPTVYRALDFLLENGLIHRINSLNAFIGCNHPGHGHHGQFLICRQCQNAQELESRNINQAIVAASTTEGFQLESQCIELSGLCQHCRQEVNHA